VKYILFLLIPIFAFSAPINSDILSIKGNKVIVKVDDVQIGVSGIVVKELGNEHSAIVANATVIKYDKEKKFALVQLSKYDALQQNALPSGNYLPEVGDKVILAASYRRALLIAENDKTYQNIVSRIPSLSWASSDDFATYLSNKGHPTPLSSDFQEFCSDAQIGLLYISLEDSLFTMDCASMTLLQTMPMESDKEEAIMLPFYTNVSNIDSSWLKSILNGSLWGSDDETIYLETYAPYYKTIIAKSNRDNIIFHKFLETQK
jgi:hypothetical protein